MKKLVIMLFILAVTSSGFSQTLSLDDCIELALANNPDLQKSENSLKQSEISTKQAWSSLYPSISGNAATSNSGPFVSETQDKWSWSVGGNVSQTIYQPGMYSGIKKAKVQQAVSEYSNASQVDLIRMNVEKLYLSILASDTLIGVYRASVQLADEQIIKMERMVELGLKRQSDLLRTKVTRGSIESSLYRQTETLASSKRSLNILMGRDPNTEFRIFPIQVDEVIVPEYKEAFSLAREKNPGVQQYKSQIEAQKLSLRISKEAFLPTLSGTYSVGRSNTGIAGATEDYDNFRLSLSIPIFDGFNKKLNVQSYQIKLDEAQLDYEAALRDLDDALSNQYKALETQNRVIEIDKTNLESSRNNYEEISEQYAAGFSTILDLNDAHVSVLESETNLLGDLYTRKQIEAEIRQLIGK